MSKFSWRVGKKEGGMRLLPFLKLKCPSAPSVKALKRAIDGKLCTVNSRTETFSSYLLQENDVVKLSENAFAEKQQLKLPVLYEDEGLLLCAKPAGIVCERKEVRGYFPQYLELELVHRLDKETSGVIIFAKEKKIKDALLKLFKERKVHKVYLAIVDGVPEKLQGKIDKPIGKKGGYEGQTIYGVSEKGASALTLWKKLRSVEKAALIQCEPLTGRTHQIRVHMAWMGHPILGDTQYGKHFRCRLRPQRNLLHAYRIRFIHPDTKKEIEVTAPIPADFRQAMEELKLETV